MARTSLGEAAISIEVRTMVLVGIGKWAERCIE